MADNNNRNGLSFEMPPSGKKRQGSAPVQTTQDSVKSEAKSGIKEADRAKPERKPFGKRKGKEPSKNIQPNKAEAKSSVTQKDEMPPRSPEKIRAEATRKKKAELYKKPQYAEDGSTGEFQTVKPINIQAKALRQKGVKKSRARTRRKRLSAYLIYYIMFGIIAAVVLGVLSTTVLFKAENFVVTGETVYSYDEVVKALGVNKGENMVVMDAAAVEKRLLDNLPYIDKATVSRHIFSNTLEITLVQANPAANVKKDGVYYLVSENGRIMDSDLKTPNKSCVVVTGFEPEYAVDGDFLSVSNEESRNYLSRLLKCVKLYSDIDSEYEADSEKKYAILFDLLEVIEKTGLKEKIKSIDISSIYKITLQYDSTLTLELGDISNAQVKLSVAKNLIDKGEFEGERGIIILSELTDDAYNMKVTFRPVYDGTSDNTSDSSDDGPQIGDTTEIPEE